MCVLSDTEEEDFTAPVMCSGPVRDTDEEAETALDCGVDTGRIGVVISRFGPGLLGKGAKAGLDAGIEV